MDVRDLAPALLSFGVLFTEADKELNGKGSKSSVHLKATGKGSFEALLQLSQEAYEVFAPVYASAQQIKTVILDLIGVKKWMKGRKSAHMTTENSKDDMVRLHMDKDSIMAMNEVIRLLKNPVILEALETLIAKPLKKDGIEGFKAYDNNSTQEVSKDESWFFEIERDSEPTLASFEHTYTAMFSIISVSFKADNNWRLFNGENTISVRIEDQAFLSLIDANEVSFAKDDILICKLRSSQYMNREGELRMENVVVDIIEHICSAKKDQLDWNFESEG